MLDSRPVFDSLRLSFLIPDNALAGTVRDAIYELADLRADGDAFRPVGDAFCFGYLDEAIVMDDDWSDSLNDNISALFQRCRTRLDLSCSKCTCYCDAAI